MGIRCLHSSVLSVGASPEHKLFRWAFWTMLCQVVIFIIIYLLLHASVESGRSELNIHVSFMSIKHPSVVSSCLSSGKLIWNQDYQNCNAMDWIWVLHVKKKTLGVRTSRKVDWKICIDEITWSWCQIVEHLHSWDEFWSGYAVRKSRGMKIVGEGKRKMWREEVQRFGNEMSPCSACWEKRIGNEVQWWKTKAAIVKINELRIREKSFLRSNVAATKNLKRWCDDMLDEIDGIKTEECMGNEERNASRKESMYLIEWTQRWWLKRQRSCGIGEGEGRNQEKTLTLGM